MMTAKLLVAEDSITIQKVFELTFKQTGVSLTMVDNGTDAVRMAGEISPDLVVADVSLPGKNGFEVAAELRQAGAPGRCPVLILAGSLGPFDEERFRSCGANGVLFKPFESQELLDKVDALLRSGEELPAPAEEAAEAPAVDEPWDFSDVLSEVENEVDVGGASRLTEPEELSELTAAAPGAADRDLPFADFDVSLEEIEEGPGGEESGVATMPETAEEPEPPLFSADVPEAEPGPAPVPEKPEEPEASIPLWTAAEETPGTVHHIEEPYFDDAPQAVTDLTPAIEKVEEMKGEFDMREEDGPREGKPASAESRPPETVEPRKETLPEVEALREQFSARAREIIERVAAETLEKVMWEMMDTLTKEFAEAIREAVETVAWEVVPSTAEALIREEIARIREQAGKESS